MARPLHLRRTTMPGKASQSLVLRTAAAALALGGFVALASAVAEEEPGKLDRRARAAMATRHFRVVEVALAPLDLAGYPGAYLPIAVLWARAAHRRGTRRAMLIPAAALAGWLAHRGAKMVYKRARPERRPGLRRKKSSSFPSGHTIGAAALYGGAALVLYDDGALDARDAMLLGVGAPLAMGASRVVLDWHWVTDVAAGLLLGGAVAMGIGAASAVRTRGMR